MEVTAHGRGDTTVRNSIISKTNVKPTAEAKLDHANSAIVEIEVNELTVMALALDGLKLCKTKLAAAQESNENSTDVTIVFSEGEVQKLNEAFDRIEKVSNCTRFLCENLGQIIKELKSANGSLRKRVTDLESQVCDMEKLIGLLDKKIQLSESTVAQLKIRSLLRRSETVMYKHFLRKRENVMRATRDFKLSELDKALKKHDDGREQLEKLLSVIHFDRITTLKKIRDAIDEHGLDQIVRGDVDLDVPDLSSIDLLLDLAAIVDLGDQKRIKDVAAMYFHLIEELKSNASQYDFSC